MKPILFSTPMVQAILDGRKTMTRRVVKNKDIINHWDCEDDGTPIAYIDQETGDRLSPTAPAPYQLNDILWVRETWRIGAWDYDRSAIAVDYMCGDYSRKEWLPVPDRERMDKYIIQSRADAKAARLEFDGYGEYQWLPGESPCRWRSSMFMPREAARIYLRVKEVRCERLQEITEEDAKMEGAPDCRPFECSTGIRPRTINCFIACSYRDGFSLLWNSLNAKPKPQYKTVNGKRQIISYISYPWEDIQETREFRGKPWHVCGNPWVWVYTFKRED